jgi:hypothetical protein
LNDSHLNNPARLDNPEQHVSCSGIIRENTITVTRFLRERNLCNSDIIQLVATPFGVPEKNSTLDSKVTFSIPFG